MKYLAPLLILGRATFARPESHRVVSLSEGTLMHPLDNLISLRQISSNVLDDYYLFITKVISDKLGKTNLKVM